MKSLTKNFVVILLYLATIATSFQNERILIYPFAVNNKIEDQTIVSRLKNELSNLGYNNFVSPERIDLSLGKIKLDLENCNDSCLYALASLVEAEKIITGYVLSDNNNYSITSSMRSVATRSIISEIKYDASDETDLYQFGVYYISRGLTKKNIDDNLKGKMHTVSIKSLFIDEIDFFKTSSGDPYPIIFILTENSIPIWKVYFSKLRGYRTVNEKKILAFVPNNRYQVKIYDEKLKQLKMEYVIEPEPNNWPFSANKNDIGEKSYIMFDQKIENDFYFTPNKKLILF